MLAAHGGAKSEPGVIAAADGGSFGSASPMPAGPSSAARLSNQAAARRASLFRLNPAGRQIGAPAEIIVRLADQLRRLPPPRDGLPIGGNGRSFRPLRVGSGDRPRQAHTASDIVDLFPSSELWAAR